MCTQRSTCQMIRDGQPNNAQTAHMFDGVAKCGIVCLPVLFLFTEPLCDPQTKQESAEPSANPSSTGVAVEFTSAPLGGNESGCWRCLLRSRLSIRAKHRVWRMPKIQFPQGLNGHMQTLCSVATGMCRRYLQQCCNCHNYPKKEEPTNSNTVTSFKSLGEPNSIPRQSRFQNSKPGKHARTVVADPASSNGVLHEQS